MLLHFGSFITLGLLHDVSFPVHPPELRQGPLASFSTLKQVDIVANKLERDWSLTVFSLAISLPSSLSSGPYWLNCLVNRPVASPVTASKQLEIDERFPQGPNKRGRLSQFEHTLLFIVLSCNIYPRDIVQSISRNLGQQTPNSPKHWRMWQFTVPYFL